ncbi:MAG TPA: NAD(P)/FAD-dependent oxidoreductase [Methylomirabilota bacterium]|nr:NAD(P)/FAD-dependent oxidoreductase [Methylomirabilota bacterium]
MSARAADVVVVGAGPAGAATAILLVEHGLDVVVLDRAALPRPKVCGEYLSPEAGRLLDRLGVLKALDAAGAVAIAGMRITAPDGTSVTGRYRDIGPWRPYRQHATGVDRATLDGALAERLRGLPLDFREQTRVSDLLLENGRVVGVRAEDRAGTALEIRARVVVGADGRTSVVAERLGCRHPHTLRRMALVTYVRGLPDCRDLGEIFVDPPDYAILNPLGPDRVNLSLVVPLAHAAPWSARLEDFMLARLRQLPHLARRLAGAERMAPIRALGPLAWRVQPPRAGGVVLVGDAAGFFDPFTGEGVFTALRSAELAAETLAGALRADDVSAPALAAYERARRAAFGAKERLTRALQVVIGHRRLANVVCRALARRPAALDALLGVLGDYVPVRALRPGLLRVPSPF